MITVDIQSPSFAPRFGVRHCVEIALYALGCVLIGLLGLSSAAVLLQAATERLDQGMGGYLQPFILALLVMVLGLRFALYLALASISHVRDGHLEPVDEEHWPLVSILVPAYNEEPLIEAALESLLQLDYPNYEIVVVDDGSSDRTLELARAFENRGEGAVVQVHGKANAGKWSALNLAFRVANGALLLCVDADSRLDPESLKYLVSAIGRDEMIGSVAGQIRVRNRDSVLTRLQALEYLNCNGTLRGAQTLTGDVLVVPGPLGLFRRDALQAVWDRFGSREGEDEAAGAYLGPYEHDTFAEDFDLSIALCAIGYKVIYEPRAIAHTKAPETVLTLLNQRYRWQRGSIQVLRKLWRRGATTPGLLGGRLAAWIVGTYVVDLILIPLWIVFGLPYLALTIADGGVLAQSVVELFVAFYGINLLLAVCYVSTHGDRMRVALVLPLQDIYQTFVLQAILAFVVFDEFRGAPMRW